jgi:hypothetical protein
MAFTTADIAALDRAIAASELKVVLEGREVTFDNFEGLRARREFIAGQLVVGAGSRPTGTFRYRFTTSRGD